MKKSVKYWMLSIFCMLYITNFYCQNQTLNAHEIQILINKDSLEKAKLNVTKNITQFKKENRYDSLAEYIQFQGHFKLNNNNPSQAIANALDLMEYITATKNPKYTKDAIVKMGRIYDNAGQTQKAYDLLLLAVKPAEKIVEPKSDDAASVQYSLGYYMGKIGDYPLAKKHYFRSLKLLKNSGNEDYVFYNQLYTSLGGILWQESKLDSVRYYFQEALTILKKTDSTDLKNKLFRPSLIKLNMSVLLNAMGRNKEAINISYEAIEDLQTFIANTTDEFYTRQAKSFIFSLLDNLASYHNSLGEYKRSEEIMEYSYAKKLKEYQENDISIIISNIILAEAKSINRNFEEAAVHADKALQLYKSRLDGDTYWKAAAYSTRGYIYENTGNMDLAKQFYEKGNELFRSISGDNYSKGFLDHFTQLEEFYLKIGENEKAVAIAEEAYNHVKNGDLNNTLQGFIHVKNIAKVHFKLKDYVQAIKYSNEAINYNITSEGNKMSAVDSILIQYEKPTAIMINTASRYYLNKNRTPEALESYVTEIDKAIAILDKRKKVVNTHEDITILIQENEELFNLAKKIRMELYNKTQNEKYLNQVISMHESAIYNRIRSRLGIRSNVAFKNVPKRVLDQENQLSLNISSALENMDGNVDAYIDASEKWNSFLMSLQKEYPEYYKMRYETLQQSIKDLQGKIPTNTTLVRYLFIAENLYVFVVSRSEKKMILLENQDLQSNLTKLNEENFSVSKKSPILSDLYKILWSPIEKHIKTKKVVIIPDKELFNLSFEMLTPMPIKDYNEFATNSLLSEYDISYNFSLLLYRDKQTSEYHENYVGFVPGFSKKMKRGYQLGVRDSVKLDKVYLTLLPQPFSENLIKKYAKFFEGEFFLNQKANKNEFINNASRHKIIHIGTHAESDNISPELSRLIFAKNTDAPVDHDENSLYAYEIYNIDLSSNLTILTACETGKPTYQAGEGAISLAHAFNYAGSESILTSLWNIDEVSSSQIVGYFYEFLSKGLPKDEALKNAKLKYLSTVEGRGADPQYWAGLVLMGDISPIKMEQGMQSKWQWNAGFLVIGMILFFVIRKKR